MKIVLIGPVYPYKGGIAHYTSLMYKALVKSHDVEMISFKLQYPKFLFKKEQKDYDSDSFKIEEAMYEINTVNPFNAMKVGRRIKGLKPDLVILQWWHPYFAPYYRILLGIIGNKTKKMLVCHNVFPHERFPLDRQLTKIVLKKADKYIVHSKTDESDLKSVIKNPSYKRSVHPTYDAFKIENMSREEARARLNIDKNQKLLLFFGFVREYKGLKHLLKAMPEIKKHVSDCKLMIVGDFGENKQEYVHLITELDINDEIMIYDDYIPDKEVEKYFASSDLVVLPYESATQSGIVQIAYGFEKPVVVTNVGGLPDVVEHEKTGYVVEPFNPKVIAEAVCDYFNNNREQEFSDGIKSINYKYSWDRMVEVVEALCKN